VLNYVAINDDEKAMDWFFRDLTRLRRYYACIRVEVNAVAYGMELAATMEKE